MAKSLHTPRYRRFRLKLIEARKTAGLTQTDLAANLGRPQSFVSKFELGERRLDLIEFFDVARAIGLDAVPFLVELGEIRTPTKRPRR